MKKSLLPISLLLVLVVSVFFISCKKDIDETTPTPTPEQPFAIPAASPVTGSISGIVVDNSNNPVSGADVFYGSTSYSTDANGFFDIKNVTLDKYVSTVTVNKTGYFKAVRSFSASASRNYLTIKLIPKLQSGSFSATAGGNVSLANGTAINFQSNGVVVKSTGAVYTGSVKVFASYIDPTSSDFSARVPGSMMGQDATNMYVLQSTGMIAVDIESNSGEPLQLAAGKTAAINLPIPASLQSKAPATIDTWSLDDRGVWKKEGTATRNGDHYEMQVSHFSFWNCDVPANAIYLSIHLQNQAGQPLQNTLVQLTIPNNNTWWATTYGHTDSLGNVSGLVPANQTLVMNVSANTFNCTTPLYTQNIGPFSVNSSITANVTVAASQQLTVTGTANNCSNQPIHNGTAVIHAGQYGVYNAPITNGSYSLTITHCTTISSVNVTVSDYDSQSQASSGTVAVSGNSVTVPLLTACTILQNAVYEVTGCQASGNYFTGTPLTSVHQVFITVLVQSTGPYQITTASSNGFNFSASGTFSVTGLQTIALQGVGTPVNTGAYNFFVASSNGGITGCTFTIFVTGPPPPPAVFTFGGSPGACTGAIVLGSYIAGTAIGSSNSVQITVNVSTVGSYLILTGGAANGMYFMDSGTFVSTGPQTVTLYGSGTPIQAGTFTLQVTANNVTVGCTFDVTVTAGTPNAQFTFAGSPGNCASVVVGTYSTGVALTGQNMVNLTVNVTGVGNYFINTNQTNGIEFVGSGVFTTLGVQAVALVGTGTPLQAGINTFLTSVLGAQGCIFTVTTN